MPQARSCNIEKTEHFVFLNKRSPEYHPPKDIHLQKETATVYTLWDVNTEDTIRHNIALMTSTSRFYIPYPFETIIK